MSKVDAIQCDKCGKILRANEWYFKIKDAWFMPTDDTRLDTVEKSKPLGGDYCKECALEQVKLLVGKE